MGSVGRPRYATFGALLFAFVILAVAMVPVPVAAQAPPIVISEIHYNPDGPDEGSQFIELENLSGDAVDLSGWGFAAGVGFTFAPGSQIASNGRLVIASDAATFQAEFGIAPDATFDGAISNAGERIAFVTDADELVDELTYDDAAPWPTAPDGDGASLQLLDLNADNSLAVSWGAGIPTPRAGNSAAALEPIAPVAELGRGAYGANVTETLSTLTPGAQIRYTLNGRAPNASSTLYTGPIQINGPSGGMATLRAITVLGNKTSPESVHSYVFTSTFPHGDGNWDQVPTVSIRTDDGSVPGPATATERTSIDFIDPDGIGFGVTAGVKLFGESSVNYAKKSHRLFFDSDWGPSNLEYDIFGDYGHGTIDPVDSFDKLELRGQSWDGINQLPAHDYYISDRFWKDTILDLGSLSPHGRYVHLFLNGSYNGVYQLRERFDEPWFASYTGADSSDYSMVKRGGRVPGGDPTLFNAVSAASSWSQARDLLNPQALIHHELLRSLEARGEEEYRLVGSSDPQHPDSGAILLYSDVDMLFGDVPGNSFWNWGPHGPNNNGYNWLWKWRSDPELLQISYAETFKAFCNDGPMSVVGAVATIDRLADQLRPAMTAESSRWPNVFEASITLAKRRISGQNGNGLGYVAQQWQTQGLFAGCAAGGRPEPVNTNTVMFTGRDAIAPIAISDPDNDPFTVSALSSLPGGVAMAADGTFSGRPTVAPGEYPVTLRIEDNRGLWGEWQHTISVINGGNPVADSPIVLNEFNAVDADAGTWTGTDPAFPNDPTNGGDWLELVVVDDYTDLRDWTVELWDRDNPDGRLELADSYRFANNPIWQDTRQTTLITIAETADQDLALAPEGGDWNVVVNPNGGLISGSSRFDSTRRNFMITIRDAQGNLVGEPTGETDQWRAAGGGNVTAANVMALCVTPTAEVDVLADYRSEATNSTFGQPNICEGLPQDLDIIRSTLINPGDANCDGSLGPNDAQLVLDYLVGLRTTSRGCPLGDPASEANIAGADLDGDRNTSLLDALISAQCSAGIDNGYCP